MFFKAISSSLKKPLRRVLPHFGLAACSIIYVCLGSILFYNLERPHEITTRQGLLDRYQAIKQTFLNKTMSTKDAAGDPEKYVDSYIEELFELWEHPLAATTFGSSVMGQETEEDQWTPMSSFLFAATTVIPVGYGFITPATKIGRLAIIVYGLFGTPLALITVTDIGEFISPFILKIFSERIPGLTGVGCLLLLASYILLGAAFFCLSSKLNVLDSIYFSIISVFTIGFGDTPPPVPIPYLIVFIIMGVILVTITVEIVAADVIHQVHYMGRKMGDARKFAGKMFQMAQAIHFTHSKRVGVGHFDAFSRLGLLMNLEKIVPQQAEILAYPRKIPINRAYDPKNLHLEFVDVTSPGSSQNSAKSGEILSISSAFLK